MLFAHKKVYDDAAEYFEEMKKETEEKRAEREEVWAEKELSEKEKEEAAELRYWFHPTQPLPPSHKPRCFIFMQCETSH